MRNTMFNLFKKKKLIKKEKIQASFDIELTAAVLAYEVARSDGEVSNSELKILLDELKKISTKVGKSSDMILALVEDYNQNSASFYEFIQDINNHYTKEDKISLIKLLWDVAYSDNILEVNEERLIRRIADLINIKDIEVLKLKHFSKVNKNI